MAAPACEIGRTRIESKRSKLSSPMAAPACEIGRLPEELLSEALSRTSPRDACRAAAVSPDFRAAADSDSVWACFLPPSDDLPPLADGELPGPLPRKKDLFLRLSDSPVLLQDKLVSMWLDRETGAKCYMLSARALHIVWSCTPKYWSWIPLPDSRFSEGAELLDVCWFEIRGKIAREMLSQDTSYAAYIVFKVNSGCYGLDYPVPEASIRVGETNLTREVCFLQQRDDGENVGLPLKRDDGWMELELGEFLNDRGDEDGEVSFSLMELKGRHWKRGLIVQGIEIRRKKSG